MGSVVKVPEFDGYVAAGASYEHAIANAVMADWVETALSLGRSIPEHRPNGPEPEKSLVEQVFSSRNVFSNRKRGNVHLLITQTIHLFGAGGAKDRFVCLGPRCGLEFGNPPLCSTPMSLVAYISGVHR
jgi:predicted RNase H-like HicB family nuclease